MKKPCIRRTLAAAGFLIACILPASKLELLSSPEPPSESYLITIECPFGTLETNESRVAVPAEEAFMAVSGIRSVRSTTGAASVRLVCIFDPGAPADTYLRLCRVTGNLFPLLPPGTGKPVIKRGGGEEGPVYIASFKDSCPAENREIAAAFESIRGTGEVAGPETRSQIFIIPGGPSSDSLSIMDISSELGKRNILRGMNSGDERLILDSRIKSQLELSEILPGGADTVSKEKVREVITRINGMEQRIFSIGDNGTVSAGRLCGKCREVTEKYDGTEIYSYGTILGRIFRNILLSFAAGTAAIFLVLLLLFRTPAAGITGCVCIVFSSAAGLAALSILGMKLDMLSAAGLAAGTGITVDSIILLGRQESAGKGPSSRLLLAGSTLTNVVVFLPLIFTRPEISSGFLGLAVAFSTAVITSAVFAAIFTPRIRSNSCESAADSILGFLPKPPRRSAAVFCLLSIAAVCSLPLAGFSAAGAAPGAVILRLLFSEPAAPERSAALLTPVEATAMNLDAAGTVITTVRTTGAELLILPSTVRRLSGLKKEAGKIRFAGSGMFLDPGSAASAGGRRNAKIHPVRIILKNSSLFSLYEAAEIISARIREELPEFGIINYYNTGLLNCRISPVSSERLPSALTAESVRYQLFNLLAAPVRQKSDLDGSGFLTDIRLGLPGRLPRTDLVQLRVYPSGPLDSSLPVTEAASIMFIMGPGSIQRTGGVRCAEIEIRAPGISRRKLCAKIRNLLSECRLPPGTAVSADEDILEFRKLYRSAVLWVLSASVLVIIVLTAVAARPRAVIFSALQIPVSCGLPVLVIHLSGNSPGFSHFAGLALVSGVAVNNGLAAVFRGRSHALRTALSSAATTCAGALPMIFPSPASAPMAGFAVVIIAGSAASFMSIWFFCAGRGDQLSFFI